MSFRSPGCRDALFFIQSFRVALGIDILWQMRSKAERVTREVVVGQVRSSRLPLPVFPGPELRGHSRGLNRKAAVSPGGKGDRLVDSD